jgi:hypothetical protein
MLMSPLVIPAAKHKIRYSYVVHLQTFSLTARPHADKKTNNCTFAFRGYEMAKTISVVTSRVSTYEIETSLLQRFI